MKQNRKKLIAGWILFLVAIGLFCLQMGYLLVHDHYQVEYIDNRLFYLINILFVVCILLALILLLRLPKKFLIIAITAAGLIIILQTVLLTNSNNEIRNYISISPNFKHIFSIKKNVASGEAYYYRSYYGILARPKEKLGHKIHGEYKVQWLAKDVATFTYQAPNETIQQFIGTYGDRNKGLSYYYVGAEIQGVWKSNNITVVSSPDGISVTENNHTEQFEWDDIHQFGTLAVVLKKNNEAIWTISLNENFVVESDSTIEKEGNITIYKAVIENEQPVVLHYKGPN